MNKPLGKIIIICIAIIMIILIIIIAKRILSSGQKTLEEQLAMFFDIPFDENIIISEVQLIEFDELYAELLINSEDREDIFRNYQNASKETNKNYLPPTIRARIGNLSPKHELDYYYILFATVERGNILSMEANTQEKHIIFMQEQDGKVLVLLFCTHADGQWQRRNR